MPDYANGKIYKITSADTTKVYVGSTTQALEARLAQHITRFKKKVGKCTVVKILAFPNAEIELIEAYPCENNTQLLKREGYYIKNLNSVNRCVSGRDSKQYYIDNMDTYKQYYNDHKKAIRIQQNQYKKQYNIDNRARLNQKHNCPCGGKYNRGYKARHFETKKHKNYELIHGNIKCEKR